MTMLGGREVLCRHNAVKSLVAVGALVWSPGNVLNPDGCSWRRMVWSTPVDVGIHREEHSRKARWIDLSLFFRVSCVGER